ncbi:MAG: CAP domain-containing protein [Sandaracinaceae bacterium]|nr:CAP domain-containing protein [Sandaracinaceae bacterium]
MARIGMGCAVGLFACGCELFGGGSTPVGGAVYTIEPDVSECEPGELSEGTRAALLQYVNRIREMHALAPVEYAYQDDPLAQASALWVVANARTSHTPQPGTHCHSDLAVEGAVRSLLFMAAGNQVGVVGDPARYIDAWMIDADTPSLGHRRFLLDPFLGTVAFGLVDGEPRVEFQFRPVVGAALRVVEDTLPSLVLSAPSFVAYPYGDYPTNVFPPDAVLSFSAVPSRFGYGPNQNVDYSMVRISVRDAESELPVSSIASLNSAEGIPNLVSWRVEGLAADTQYDVRLENVLVFGAPRSYEYQFRLTAPIRPEPPPAPPDAGGW